MKEALWYGLAAGSGGAVIAGLILIVVALWPDKGKW
jgi:hypothetical protein